MNKNQYTAYNFNCIEEEQDLLIAFLNNFNFDSYVQEPKICTAYIESQIQPTDTDLIEVLNNAGLSHVQFEKKLVENINWNEEWERNFEPILIDNTVFIRALFHQPIENIKHEIIIQPKMSFGTGHHATTQLMVQQILQSDFKNKTVLDMGCGTGVLGILAAQLGAQTILGIDNEEWAVANAIENCATNKIENMKILLGDEKLLGDTKFDFILSNITKNFNMANLAIYAKVLNTNGTLIISGFYEADVNDLVAEAQIQKLNKIAVQVLNNWACIQFKLA